MWFSHHSEKIGKNWGYERWRFTRKGCLTNWSPPTQTGAASYVSKRTLPGLLWSGEGTGAIFRQIWIKTPVAFRVIFSGLGFLIWKMWMVGLENYFPEYVPWNIIPKKIFMKNHSSANRHTLHSLLYADMLWIILCTNILHVFSIHPMYQYHYANLHISNWPTPQYIQVRRKPRTVPFL